MRLRWLACSLCVLSVAGCQSARPAWVPGKTEVPVQSSDLTARWERSRELALPLEIEATVTRLGGDAPLASLRGKVDTRGAMVFETSERDEPTRARLAVQVEPRKEGGYALGVSWDEHAPEGRVVSWHPSLVLERGAETTAEIGWADGDGRRLTLRIVEPVGEPGKPPADAAAEPAAAIDARPLADPAAPEAAATSP